MEQRPSLKNIHKTYFMSIKQFIQCKLITNTQKEIKFSKLCYWKSGLLIKIGLKNTLKFSFT